MLPGLLARVGAVDEALTARVREVDHAGLDRTMWCLSAAADHSALWAASALVLAASGRPGVRRAAVVGLGSAALSSLLVNQGLKRAVPRPRPAPGTMPERRRLRKVPASGSFPSGHAASAAAFATGTACLAPGTALVLAPLATGVAYSRVHSGVHHASDVVVGGAVGAGVAALVARLVARPGLRRRS